MFSLSGKKALVTGATGGIGGAIAKALHQAGAQLAVSGSKQEKLEAVAKELASPSPAIAGEGRGGGLAANIEVAGVPLPNPPPFRLRQGFGGHVGERGLV